MFTTMKRMFLWGLVNIAIMVMINIVLEAFGVRPYIEANGINYQSLMIFCLAWGGVGSLFSLLTSKWMAKRFYPMKSIEEGRGSQDEQWLYNTVRQLSQSAGLPKTPEVAIYQSAEVNAFATGPSKSNSLVAVSSGLLQRMDRSQVAGVLGHEVAHIANGDMVTMTLLQGVVNAFVMFFARVLAFALENAMRDEEGRGPGMFAHFAFVILFEIVFGIIGQIIVSWFSRYREYRADAGGAQFAGRQNMIAALQGLQRTSELVDTEQAAIASLKISGRAKGLMALLASHPPLEKRIRRLQMGISQ